MNASHAAAFTESPHNFRDSVNNLALAGRAGIADFVVLTPSARDSGEGRRLRNGGRVAQGTVRIRRRRHLRQLRKTNCCGKKKEGS